MFGGRKLPLFSCFNKALTKFLAPPSLSPAELKEQEAEATLTVQKIIVGAVLLYLCKCLEEVYEFERTCRLTNLSAPFAIDAVKKLV
jgi:hypothetical protein